VGEQIIVLAVAVTVVAVVDVGVVVVIGIDAAILICGRHGAGAYSELSPRKQWQGEVNLVKRGEGIHSPGEMQSFIYPSPAARKEETLIGTTLVFLFFPRTAESPGHR
jgi:hypothetical protein